MGKARTKAAKRRTQRISTKIKAAVLPPPANDVEGKLKATIERETFNDFRSAGPAVKVIPPIETLYSTGKINERQFQGLARYADIANAAERSEIKSNIDFSVYGTGEGLPHFGVRMRIELGLLMKALEHQNLKDIAHAICVREISVSQWAMERSGSVMRERLAQGGKIVRWYEPRKMAHRIALYELQEAADRLAKEIGI
jgi:hypothetical protein